MRMLARLSDAVRCGASSCSMIAAAVWTVGGFALGALWLVPLTTSALVLAPVEIAAATWAVCRIGSACWVVLSSMAALARAGP
jgi:hypothetical protein